MKHKVLKLVHILFTLIMLASLLVFASPVKAASNNLWVWGSNGNGQLGREPVLYLTEPVQAVGITGGKAIEAGRISTLVIKRDGTVWGFGYNGGGNLGDGTVTTIQPTPVQSIGLTSIVSIAEGNNFSLAVKSDGTVWGYGANPNNQIGNTSRSIASTPVQIIEISGAIAVSAGNLHSLVLKSDGTVWALGDNSNGQLGDGTYTTRLTPGQVPGLTGVVALGAKNLASLALKSDGTVWAWGSNTFGIHGNGELGSGKNSVIPVQVGGLTGVVAIALGQHHALALKPDGSVWAWGTNEVGLLGDGTNETRTSPVQVKGLSGIVAIDTTYLHSLALKSDGTVWAWGANDYGQLGPAVAAQYSATPIQVPGLSGVGAISTGTSHSIAIQSPDAPSTVGAAPAAGATNVPTNTAISWVAVPFANYDFQLSTNANFATLTANISNTSNTTYIPATPLAQNTTYYWRVRSRLMTLTSAWVTGTFTTVAPPAPAPTVTPAPVQPATPATVPPTPTPAPTITPPSIPEPASSTPWGTILTAIIAAVLAAALTAFFVRGRKGPVAK